MKKGPKKLKPGEVCMFCGSTGSLTTKQTRPICALCDGPFIRGQKWRLFRGKRVHIACWEKL